MQIDRRDIKKATSATQLSEALKGDRIKITLALLGGILSGFLLLYMALDKDRLELVYLEQQNIDVPTLLPKVRSSTDVVNTDRWVRGFVNRFVAYFFIQPDDSDEFANQSLVWLHAHSGAGGQQRALSLYSDLGKYNMLRKTKFTSFYPKNDFDSMKIRKSQEDSSVFFVEQPGTFIIKTEAGEAFYDAKLKLVIERVPVSGVPSLLGGINVGGLMVKNGALEYVEDPTKAQEVTSWPLFGKTL